MDERGLILMAGGGHGRVVLDALISIGIHVYGIVDPKLARDDQIFGVSVLGTDEWLDSFGPSDFLLVNGCGAIPRTNLRYKIFNTWKQRGFEFVTVVHPQAQISRHVEMCEGAQVMAGAVVQCGVVLGCNAVVNTGSNIDHDVTIGAHSFIGPGVTLCGNVSLAEQVFIGAGATLLPGIVIGAGALVGAGAVVTHDVAPGDTVCGNPAKRLKE